MAEELLDCEYFENPVLTRSGEHRLVAWHNSCIRDASGKIVGGLSAGEDITERRRAENALNVALTKYKTLFDNFPMGITVTDPGGQALETNAVAERLLGNVAHARMGRGVVRVDGSPMPVEEFASVRALREKRRVENVEMGVVQEDGRTVWISATADLLPLEGYGAVVTYSDITERRAAEERIHQLAYFDPLTNLPNRRLLMDRLGQALIASQRSQNHGAVLIIDLDRFKGLNDSHGHDVGDKLLVEVAQRLIANVRREDTVARLGGDEYVLILEGIGEDRGTAARQADHVAKKVCRALCRPYALTPLSIPYACSASIGLTMFLGDQLSEDVLLKQADIALYQAKGAGRERVMAFQDGIL
jgi:diguanylate cyclase (GGDEF)-like protein/PAS domain S-box-containing protein